MVRSYSGKKTQELPKKQKSKDIHIKDKEKELEKSLLFVITKITLELFRSTFRRKKILTQNYQQLIWPVN